jgi:hypothetical protein
MFTIKAGIYIIALFAASCQLGGCGDVNISSGASSDQTQDQDQEKQVPVEEEEAEE